MSAGALTDTYDLALLPMKTRALPAAITDVAPGPALVPFLNGMAHLDVLSNRFGTAVLGGLVRSAMPTAGQTTAGRRAGAYPAVAAPEINGTVRTTPAPNRPFCSDTGIRPPPA